MTEEKEKIWEEATKKSYAENANGTNWDRISIAMDLYAEREVKKLKQAHVSGMLVCPFCGDVDFDKEGLKYHLDNYCDEFRQTNLL